MTFMVIMVMVTKASQTSNSEETDLSKLLQKYCPIFDTVEACLKAHTMNSGTNKVRQLVHTLLGLTLEESVELLDEMLLAINPRQYHATAFGPEHWNLACNFTLAEDSDLLTGAAIYCSFDLHTNNLTLKYAYE